MLSLQSRCRSSSRPTEIKKKKEEEKKKEASLSNRQRVELFKKVTATSHCLKAARMPFENNFDDFSLLPAPRLVWNLYPSLGAAAQVFIKMAADVVVWSKDFMKTKHQAIPLTLWLLEKRLATPPDLHWEDRTVRAQPRLAQAEQNRFFFFFKTVRPHYSLEKAQLDRAPGRIDPASEPCVFLKSSSVQ